MNQSQAIQWLEESAELLDWTQKDPITRENGGQFVKVPRIAMRITGQPVY